MYSLQIKAMTDQDQQSIARPAPSCFYTSTVPKLAKIDLQIWIPAIHFEAMALDIEAELFQPSIVPSVDQPQSISVPTSAILSWLPEKLLVSIITPDMTINPKRIISSIHF